MLKSTITIIVISIFLGLFVGFHVPQIRIRQAARELCSRKCGINIETVNSAFKPFMTRRAKILPLGGALESLDGVCVKCLELFCFFEPKSIKTAPDEKLYVTSTFDDMYQLGCNILHYSRWHRHYQESLEMAKMTMALRGPAKLHNTYREGSFAECLIYLGMYSDAEGVLKNKSLLPVESVRPLRHVVEAQREICFP